MERTIIMIFIVFMFVGCNIDKKPEVEVNKAQTTERIEQVQGVSDSIVITASMVGDANRLDLLQQKVMHKAKVKIADSLFKVFNSVSDSAMVNRANYDVAIHDIRVIKEGVRYPEPNNPSKIEAYITLGVKIPM